MSEDRKLQEPEAPRVPDYAIVCIQAYGDARADDDGTGALRLKEAITELRRWGAALSAPPASQPTDSQLDALVEKHLPGYWNYGAREQDKLRSLCRAIMSPASHAAQGGEHQFKLHQQSGILLCDHCGQQQWLVEKYKLPCDRELRFAPAAADSVLAAIRAAGFTLAKTANGHELLKLGLVEAQTATAPAQAGEAEPVAVEPLPFRGPIEKAMELADAYADGPHELGYYGRRRTELFEFLSFVLSHASPFYLGGPYAATGEFAICETATGRVLRRFRDERDLLTTPASSPEDKRDAERLDHLEQLTHQGHAPAIVFDDNGNWAVSCDGASPVPEGDVHTETVTVHAFVEPEQWRPTLREAIDADRESRAAIDSARSTGKGE